VDCYKDWHFERLTVRPGITGLAQVYGRSTLLFDEIAAYDIEYIRSLSLGIDLSIMVATIRIVGTRKGAL
jgi:lipopolysaccharide/colanic/teichoic acid biosynthesis glycosyltransferase